MEKLKFPEPERIPIKPEDSWLWYGRDKLKNKPIKFIELLPKRPTDEEIINPQRFKMERIANVQINGWPTYQLIIWQRNKNSKCQDSILRYIINLEDWETINFW
jgi:hypothetical protein